MACAGRRAAPPHYSAPPASAHIFRPRAMMDAMISLPPAVPGAMSMRPTQEPSSRDRIVRTPLPRQTSRAAFTPGHGRRAGFRKRARAARLLGISERDCEARHAQAHATTPSRTQSTLSTRLQKTF